MYGLLTKCGVKMAEYWPSSFLACLWTETKSRSINSQKKHEANIHRTNLANKGFIIWLSGKFFMRDTAGSPEQARWLHLACSGRQSHRAIWFILPACGAGHIINMGYWPNVRSRQLDISQVLFLRVYGPRWSRGASHIISLDISLILCCVFPDLDSISVHKQAIKERGHYLAILITCWVNNS